MPRTVVLMLLIFREGCAGGLEWPGEASRIELHRLAGVIKVEKRGGSREVLGAI
jgi:hypothetical protein